ncbi:SDR family NAD(P)-dependent oxidoreductase [Actinopolymorpha pittospori]|uniref:NAD(P)-dependent dehydrogenase (Short-subunit alcohol dehydrogenase family) n=1 Tax=Actinopolymorpha pittospori TaxID=648752 RepID=A0A927RIR5_9ACTN|nr:SDR family NAD(P)-dependent oxidoreductase [Actinopolymorpha pittospori]MBE1606466.1 NAD(P)-dependent dehydrogenase (short-subunit alcohol dehydrogenase family) [Actinopolymorpha pittospori]
MRHAAQPTALITGASDGIGYETARRLASVGWNVLLHAPTHERRADALRRLVDDNVPSERLRVVAADFARLSEVRDMAETLAASHSKLDVLVNNAAIAGPPSRTVTVDGNELTFQINYLAAYLLTRRLTAQLNASGWGRVINVSSTLHRTANLDWADPQRVRTYRPVAAYAQSKLALTMFSRELAHDESDQLVMIRVHPGIVETPLRRIYSPSTPGASVSEGGIMLAHLASPQIEVTAGGYYERLTPAKPAALADKPAAVRRLARLSDRLTGLVSPTAKAS